MLAVKHLDVRTDALRRQQLGAQGSCVVRVNELLPNCSIFIEAEPHRVSAQSRQFFQACPSF